MKTTKHEVKEITWTEKAFITKRAKISVDKLPAFFAESYRTIYEAINKVGVQSSGLPCALYYSVDEAKKETDLAVAVPIDDKSKEIEGFEKIVIPKSKALNIIHYGSYEDMVPAYATLEQYVLEHGLKKEWIIEEYFSDPAVEKDSSKWKTAIYFIVK